MMRIKYGIVLICIIIFTSSCNKDVNEKKQKRAGMKQRQQRK